MTAILSPSPNKEVGIIIILSIVLGILLLAVLAMGIVMIYLRCMRVPPLKQLDAEQIDMFFHGYGSGQQCENADGIELTNTKVIPSQLPYDRSREIKMESLDFGRYIGGGQFGEVNAVTVLNWPENGVNKTGAAKSIKRDPGMTHEQFELAFLDFIHKEIKISQLVSHENVVGYIGSVVGDLGNHKAYLIVEYCSGGNLESLLEKHRQERTFYDDYSEIGQGEQEGRVMLKTSHLTKWAEQIAAGLEHMASLNIPHMDLATRNILLAHKDPELNTEINLSPDPSNLIAKISDFGMSRELNQDGSTYYRMLHPDEPERDRKFRMLPYRWMSVESLESFRFTLQSDIWSLGITLWEMFTLGDFPYEHLQIDGGTSPRSERLQFIAYFRNGGILPEPSYVPPQIWDIMKDCWSLRPEERPTPGFIKEEIRQLNEEMGELLQNRTPKAPGPSSTYQPLNFMPAEHIMEPEQGEDEPPLLLF